MVGCSTRNKNYMTGIYLKTSKGTDVILNDSSNISIIMINKTKDENMFHDLQNGDKIEITYDDINIMNPAKTGVYSCKVIESGSEKDINNDILKMFEEMGY